MFLLLAFVFTNLKGYFEYSEFTNLEQIFKAFRYVNLKAYFTARKNDFTGLKIWQSKSFFFFFYFANVRDGVFKSLIPNVYWEWNEREKKSHDIVRSRREEYELRVSKSLILNVRKFEGAKVFKIFMDLYIKKYNFKIYKVTKKKRKEMLKKQGALKEACLVIQLDLVCIG